MGRSPARCLSCTGPASASCGLDGVITIGVWSDLDGPEVRAALRTSESDRVPVRYLDGGGIPMRYKVRRVEGEPVPMNVLSAMKDGTRLNRGTSGTGC